MTSRDLPKVLIIGANGQVGRALVKELDADYNVTAAIRNSKPAFDLSQPESLYQSLNHIHPEIVINAAAYTAVDKAESEYELAHTINAKSPGVIATYCAENHVPLIHYSTDYVFNGGKKEPYIEDDPTSPINAYGKTKREGEQAIIKEGGLYYILRTSWVYDAHGNNFLNTMLKLASERDSLSIVCDQFGSPTWAGHIARETSILASRLLHAEDKPAAGIYHLTCSGETSWHDFAEKIFQVGQEKGLVENVPELSAITTDQYPTPAKRPCYSVLNNQKFQRMIGSNEMHWEVGLNHCLDEIASQD